MKVTQRMLKQYIATALWAETGDDNQPLDDKFDFDSVSEQMREKCICEIEWFTEKASTHINEILYHAENSDECMDKIMHDLWLTRNHHGAGFWDGDYEHGDELTDIAQLLGEAYIFTPDGNNEILDMEISGAKMDESVESPSI